LLEEHAGVHPMYNRAVLEQLGRVNPGPPPARAARELQRISDTLQNSIVSGRFGPWGLDEVASTMDHDYLTDWGAFVRAIISMIEAGHDEASISEKLNGHMVEWSGVIVGIKLNEEFAPGVAVSMAPGIFPISSGKLLRADYLFLNINPSDSLGWKNCNIGDSIKFRAKISKASRPFPEIQLSEADDDLEIILMIGLYECQIMSAD